VKRWFIIAALLFLPQYAQAIVLSETSSGADSAYQRQIQVDLTEYERGQEYLVWLKPIDGTYQHEITTTSQLFTIDVDSSYVYYVKVQLRKRVLQGGTYRLTTTPFDEAPEASIKIFGNTYSFYNLTVENNIIYPATVPVLKGFSWSEGDTDLQWSGGTLMFNGHVYEIVAGNSGGRKYVYWGSTADSLHFYSSEAQPGDSVWTVAGYDTLTNSMYIAESYKILWGENIRAGTITAAQIKANTITANEIAAGTITTTELAFVPVDSTNVIARINASSEGIDIEADNISIGGTTTFSSGYDPSTKFPTASAGDLATKDQVGTGDLDVTIIQGGKIRTGLVSADSINVGTLTGRKVQTAASGKRVIMDNSDNTVKVYTSSALAVLIDDGLGGGAYPGIEVYSSSGNTRTIGPWYYAYFQDGADLYESWMRNDGITIKYNSATKFSVVGTSGNITTTGTVDGVDVSAHNHSGANQGGTVSYNSLSDKPTIPTASGYTGQIDIPDYLGGNWQLHFTNGLFQNMDHSE